MIKVNLATSFDDPPPLWWLADLASFGVGIILCGGIFFAMADSATLALQAKHADLEREEHRFERKLKGYRADIRQVETKVATLKRSLSLESQRVYFNDQRTIEQATKILSLMGQTRYAKVEMSPNGWLITGTAANHIAVANLSNRLKRQSFLSGIDTLQSTASEQDQAISFRIKMKGDMP